MKTYLSIILSLLLMAALLTGCGSSVGKNAASYDVEYAAEAPAAMDADAGTALNGSAESGSTVLPDLLMTHRHTDAFSILLMNIP